MTTRRDFLQDSVAVASGMVLASLTAQADDKSGKSAVFEKLTDDTGKYILLPLPYAYDALEPVIDARTVELHYNFHHKPAVATANKALDELAKCRETGDFALVKHHEKELAFGLSSHILHTMYWSGLSAQGGGTPKGNLLQVIYRDFGSFDKFKAHMTAATIAVEGAGWGILGYLPSSGKLMILQCENHQKLTAWGVMPILVLDVWEHAYYLKYQNRRGEYVNSLFSLINWDTVAKRFEAVVS